MALTPSVPPLPCNGLGSGHVVKRGWQTGVHRSNWRVTNKPEGTMNASVLYQWEQEIVEHLPSLNSWQAANVALMSYGVMKAEGSQQQKIARQMRGREKIDSASRRIRRFLANKGLSMAAFFTEWVCWVLSALGEQRITLLAVCRRTPEKGMS